jgi:hypothetical protein
MTDPELTNCHDCGVRPGELHKAGCDVEQCPECGGQAMQCLSEIECPHCHETHIHADCTEEPIAHSLIPWIGIWPGTLECREFGWYSYFDPKNGWVRCDKDHPKASEDLNRLHGFETIWDADNARFVLNTP